jgi:hypothetical protein
LSELAVYHRTVGLFRRRTTKSRETATVDALREQTRTAEAAVEVARREVTAEAAVEVVTAEAAAVEVARPEVTAEAAVEVARREVTAEKRPNPDRPGWGMTIGQQLGRGREDRPSQV